MQLIIQLITMENAHFPYSFNLFLAFFLQVHYTSNNSTLAEKIHFLSWFFYRTRKMQQNNSKQRIVR